MSIFERSAGWRSACQPGATGRPGRSARRARGGRRWCWPAAVPTARRRVQQRQARSRSGRAGPAPRPRPSRTWWPSTSTQHPGEKVSSLYVNNDDTLQKVLTAVRGGSPPDIAYLYGSWAPNVAQIPQVVNLTKVVQRPGVNWNDFWVGERDVATVNGKVIGIPALVDNLAVVYNKTLFAQAGLPLPGPNWTWAQFVADAKKLTDPASKQFGTAYVTPGTEDTVWHWEALLWEAGGQPADRGQQEGRVRLGRRAGLAEHAADHGRHRQVHVPGPDRLGVRQPVQLGQDRHAGHRARGTCPRSPTCTTACRSCRPTRAPAAATRPSPGRTTG